MVRHQAVGSIITISHKLVQTSSRMANYVATLFFLAVLGVVNAVDPLDEPANGDVRLVDGDSVNCGRVEVFYDGEWGTVCDDRWSHPDGDVVCKQLGYIGAETIHKKAHFGEGQGRIWLDDVGCRREQNSISECRHNGWGVHDCKHKEDAGVCCERTQAPKPLDLPVRLRCPKCNEGGSCNACPDRRDPSPSDCQPRAAVRGIVEVEVNGQWGPVSAEGWDVNEATVVCGQLGYPMAYPSGNPPPTIRDVWPDYGSEEGSGTQCDTQSLRESDSYRRELGNTYLQGVECSGREARLLDCYFSGIGMQSNSSYAVAVVQCGSIPDINCDRDTNKTYRLRGGAVPWAGRVEVKMNGEWGTVCDTGFDALESNIICRDLGYGTVKQILTRAGYGRGVGKIHLAYIGCTGTELKIEDCPYSTGRDAEYCGHQGDVGVECHAPDDFSCSSSSTHNVKMWQHTGTNGVIRTYPQIMGPSDWGLFCYSSTPMVDVHAGEVICRQTMGQFVTRISRGDLPTNYRGSNYSGFIRCTGDEASLSECNVLVQKYQYCSGGYTIVDCSPAAPDLVPDLSKLRLSLESRYYIDRLPLYTLTCAAEERCLSSSAYGASQNSERHLLRFDSHTWNWGISDFLPVNPRSEWEWHSCHNHYHSMETFVEYDLLNSETGVKVAEGHKASFCLEDSECARGYYSRFTCSTVQGISVNCGDLYPSYLDCQWIDVTGVPAGNYIVQQIVNPQHLVVESDYRNNEMSCNITIKAILENLFAYDVHDCWLSDHEGTSTGFY